MSPERQHAIYTALMAARRRLAHSCMGRHSPVPVCAACYLDDALGLLAIEEVRSCEAEPVPATKRIKRVKPKRRMRKS